MSLVKTTSNGNIVADHLSLFADQLGKQKPAQVRVAAASAINRATTSVRSTTATQVGRRRKLPASMVKSRLFIPDKPGGGRKKLGRATAKFLDSRIYIYKSGIPWIAIAKNGKGIFQGSRIKYKGKKGNKILSIGTRTGGRQIARGFTNVVGPKKNLHVLARGGKDRYPITLPKEYIHEDANRMLVRNIKRTFRIEYEKAMERNLKFKIQKIREKELGVAVATATSIL